MLKTSAFKIGVAGGATYNPLPHSVANLLSAGFSHLSEKCHALESQAFDNVDPPALHVKLNKLFLPINPQKFVELFLTCWSRM